MGGVFVDGDVVGGGHLVALIAFIAKIDCVPLVLWMVLSGKDGCS